jgi:hypothetical protein
MEDARGIRAGIELGKLQEFATNVNADVVFRRLPGNRERNEKQHLVGKLFV